MSSDRDPGEKQSMMHSGPITPPSLGEIYQISLRRQRTRYRLVQGSLAAVVVAGVGIGLASRDSSPTASSDRQPPTAETEVDPDLSGEFVSPPNSLPHPEDLCLIAPPDGGVAAWMVDGQAAYAVDMPIPLSEVEQLAEAWGSPADEVTALVGLADRSGVALEIGSLDDAFHGWYDGGRDIDQLVGLADAWNVSTISVKVFAHIDGDATVKAALADCGLDSASAEG